MQDVKLVDISRTKKREYLKAKQKKGDGGHRLDRSGSEQGQVAGCCKCGDEPSGFITFGGISSVTENLLAS
jgi:hypothetical protein